jgi:hypothetical protein
VGGRAVAMADAAALERSPFAALPHALFVKVLLLLPVDARAVCAAVCKGWHNTLADASLWMRLDLSRKSGGVADERVTDALLRGAAGKAQDGLTALDVSSYGRLTHAALLEVLTANAGALTELRARRGLTRTTAEQIEAILAAAPLLRVCHADMQADAAVACRMLRSEPPFGPLRLHYLSVQRPWPGGEEDVRALVADLTASASSLSQLVLIGAPLAGHGALDAVVDAALARRLSAFGLIRCSLSAVSAPALARLLGGSALENFSLYNAGDAPLLLSGAEGSAALLAAALRANSTLTQLAVPHCNVWFDAAAAETLFQALTGHPSVQRLLLLDNTVRAADRARAGASLGALVAANAPALQVLCVSGCTLGDEGLGPLVDALAANTHLRELRLANNNMSKAFALDRLMPALLANTSLRVLTLESREDAASPGVRRLEALVAERAAARVAVARR